jgi:hypothetical protein
MASNLENRYNLLALWIDVSSGTAETAERFIWWLYTEVKAARH